jgi:hypothetical protein
MAGGKLISTGVEFPDATTQTTSGLPLTGGALTGAVTTTSTFDGRDVAADGVTADAALPKAGGTMTGDTLHGDNVKAKFGAGDDLQISHNGTNSLIQDAGTGILELSSNGSEIKLSDTSGNNLARFFTGGETQLHCAGNLKLATKTTGVDVTGSVTCDGFTSTGIDDNATTELLQLDATNSIVRVGDVLNTANTQLHFRQSAIDGTHYIISYANTKHLAIKNQDAAGDLYFSAGGAERMRIDSAGIVTTPYQPAFSAYLSASVSVAAGWHSVTPNTTYFNVGNDYSTSTGYFTAPVSGKYLISATYHSNVTTNYLYIGVLVNNVNSTPYFEGRRTVNDEYTSDNTLGGSTILNLAAGDTVRLRCYSDVAFSISGGNTRTSFSGYLLG